MGCHKETLVYLISKSKEGVENSPFAGELGAVLLIGVISSEFIDVALELVLNHPHMTTLKDKDNNHALHILAGTKFVFPSGESFSWLQKFIYKQLCRIGTEEQNDWYFFSHKDKKYPTGTRTNRATAAGFWKATGRDKAIYSKQDLIGMRKTLVFYKGRAPNGQKSDWIMHEYRLETDENGTPQARSMDDTTFHIWPTRSPKIRENISPEDHAEISAEIRSSQPPSPSINTSTSRLDILGNLLSRPARENLIYICCGIYYLDLLGKILSLFTEDLLSRPAWEYIISICCGIYYRGLLGNILSLFDVESLICACSGISYLYVLCNLLSRPARKYVISICCGIYYLDMLGNILSLFAREPIISTTEIIHKPDQLGTQSPVPHWPLSPTSSATKPNSTLVIKPDQLDTQRPVSHWPLSPTSSATKPNSTLVIKPDQLDTQRPVSHWPLSPTSSATKPNSTLVIKPDQLDTQRPVSHWPLSPTSSATKPNSTLVIKPDQLDTQRPVSHWPLSPTSSATKPNSTLVIKPDQLDTQRPVSHWPLSPTSSATKPNSTLVIKPDQLDTQRPVSHWPLSPTSSAPKPSSALATIGQILLTTSPTTLEQDLTARLHLSLQGLHLGLEGWDFTSGPDLSYIYSYTSILRLGLTAGILLMPPINHVGTRGPSSALQAKPGTPARETPEDHVPTTEEEPALDTPFLVQMNLGWIRLSLFEGSMDDTTFHIWPTRSPNIRENISPEDHAEISAEIRSSQPPSPSINTRRQEDVFSIAGDSLEISLVLHKPRKKMYPLKIRKFLQIFNILNLVLPNHIYLKFNLIPFVPMYPRAPYPMPPLNYWQNTYNPYLTPSTYYGYHNPQPNDSPMEKEPATPTSVPETQLSERETPIDLEHLDKVDIGGEGKKKRSNWSKAEDELIIHERLCEDIGKR
ncbi:hypothetical protein F511_29770 [Dorcoceras hygrometricum]|uniref:NAC domain-containing protein n=1 Tax=Dorcoceras hygrometricum TaxID=472368 RepID=A0A2Z7BDN6_9LAMI|nr:hypothetical protein F511_29770 [Dorcoceras hygrometricum]